MDLVERLREWREHPYYQPDLTAEDPEDLMADAADEIERLRALIGSPTPESGQ